MKSKHLFETGLLAALILLTSGCMPFWSGRQMQEDIEALRAEQEALNESLKAKEAELTQMIASARGDVTELQKVLTEATELLRRNNADFGVEMEKLREEVERLRGQVEESNFKLARLEQDLKLFKEDVDLRFADGGALNMPDDPKELFKFGADKFESGDFRSARKAFETFARKHPKDRRLDEAIFFVGESFFKEGQWVSAVYEYQKILKQHSKSDRVDDAAFRIGEAFVNLGKCQEAQIFFETIVKDYPKSKFRNTARGRLKDIKGGKCS